MVELSYLGGSGSRGYGQVKFEGDMAENRGEMMVLYRAAIALVSYASPLRENTAVLERFSLGLPVLW